MPRIQPYRRRSSSSFWLGLLLVLLMAGGTVVGLLMLLGVSLNPFADPRDDPFMVRMPINSRPIPAYTRVEREHLLDPATGGLAYQRIPPEAVLGMSITGIADDGSHVESTVRAIRNASDEVVFVTDEGHEVRQDQTLELGGVMMNVSDIVGRVVRQDARPGLGFHQGIFFPLGTPSGIAGATPPGMRAVTLDATKLTGVHALNAGDRIDLMASVPASELGSFQSQYESRLPAAALVASPSGDRRSDSATEPVLLAQNAIVLKPVYIRQETTSSASLMQGRRMQNVPKYEVALAVSPEDVIPLQSALDKSLAITCVAHSMQPSRNEVPVAAGHPTEDTVPVTVRPIFAYEVVTREAFINPGTRRIRMQPVSRQDIDRLEIITSLDEALGAVTRHDIPAGHYLRRSDLLSGTLPERPASAQSDRSAAAFDGVDEPFQFVAEHRAVEASQAQADDAYPSPTAVGDRPAITRFIPPGRRALAVPWNLLYGAEHLQIEDRLDLLASYPLERQRGRRTVETRADASTLSSEHDETTSRETDRTRDESLAGRAEPWFVASDAIVVGPVGFPAPAAALRAIGSGRPGEGRGATALSGPAILLAVDDRDVETMITALNTPDVLFSVAFRSQGLEDAPDGYRRIAVAPVELPAWQLFSDLNWKGLRRDIPTRLVRTDDPAFDDALGADRIGQYFGRVLNRTKRRFDFFTADDFLPEGAQPGVAAGIAPGAMAVNVMGNQIARLGWFQENDRVALMLAGDFESPANAVLHNTMAVGHSAQVVVQDARIIRAASDTSEMVTLEVMAEDVAALEAALSWQNAGSRSLVAVARPRGDQNSVSNHPNASQSVDLRDHTPYRDARKFETLIGRQRQVHIFEPPMRTQP
ncbi:MAG: hypothetical protein EA424_28530 [Planctomycetaceae bacterium]|nr:MAG: hypothetical protein EA424_28530 [Planctomycetaceae bacterium]